VGVGQHIVILGTGGTIAGTGSDPDKSWQYQAGQLTVDQLLDAVPALRRFPLRSEQVAQIDSKDMCWAVWQRLAQAIQRHLAQEDVGALVITHGTDTLEETAYLLHSLHDGKKPIVLTAAMRPATAPDAAGPQNLLDAVRIAQWGSLRGMGGVVAVMSGQVWSGAHVRKRHSHDVAAFDGGDASALASVLNNGDIVSLAESWPRSNHEGWALLLNAHCPPRVECVFSHADADGTVVTALQRYAPDLKGLLVACTGNGTLNQPLAEALVQVQSNGVVVWRSSRVASGGVVPREGDVFPAVPDLTAAQARLALVLHVLGARCQF